MTRLILRILPVLVTGSVLLLQGTVFGFLSGRWGPSADLQAAVARLNKVPMIVGEWQGENRPPLNPREVELAGFAGYLVRSYRNSHSGAVFNILLACGRSGPMSVHSPDICYRGAGYEPKNIGKMAVDEPQRAEFFKAQFARPDAAEPVELRIVWAWNARGAWQAPTNPRVGFAGAPVVYKLYVIQEMIRDDLQAEATGNEFLKQLIPALDRSLFPR